MNVVECTEWERERENNKEIIILKIGKRRELHAVNAQNAGSRNCYEDGRNYHSVTPYFEPYNQRKYESQMPYLSDSETQLNY